MSWIDNAQQGIRNENPTATKESIKPSKRKCYHLRINRPRNGIHESYCADCLEPNAVKDIRGYLKANSKIKA